MAKERPDKPRARIHSVRSRSPRVPARRSVPQAFGTFDFAEVITPHSPTSDTPQRQRKLRRHSGTSLVRNFPTLD
jgi:hypothetical protein